MHNEWVLASLFGSSFLSATLLPGNSEILLVVLLTSGSTTPWVLVLVASLGNTLGGMTNVLIGRLLPEMKPQRGLALTMGWLQRYGALALLLSWLPVVGDLLCVLAGWLRMPWVAVACCLCVGKVLRYLVITLVTLQGMTWWG